MPPNRRVNPQDYNKNPLQPNQEEDPNANPVEVDEVDAMSTLSVDDNIPQQGSSNMIVFGEGGNGLNSLGPAEHPTIQQIYNRRPQHQIFVDKVDMAQARRRFLGGSSQFLPGSRDYYGLDGGSLLHHYVEEEEEGDGEEEGEGNHEGGMPYQIQVWIHISNIQNMNFNENDNSTDNNNNDSPS